MTDGERRITTLLQTALQQYPGGMRAAFKVMGEGLSYSTLAADLNPNSEQGRLKVGTLIRGMEATGVHDPLFCLCAQFGYSPVPLDAAEPDAPTLLEEIIQDYPDVVTLHRAAQDYRLGRESMEGLLAKMEVACANLRQTATRAIKGDEA